MKQPRETSLIGSIARYSFSKIYVTALGVLGVFVRPKLLTPEMYGLWNLLNIIPNYATYAHLGARDSMRYLIPFHKGDDAKVSEISGTVFWGGLYVNAAITGALILLTFKPGLRMDERIGVVVMAGMVMLAWHYEYYLTLLKSHQQFRLITLLNYMKASMNLGFGVVLIYYLQIYGAYLTSMLTVTILLLWIIKEFKPGPPGNFNTQTFISLIKTGFPIMSWEVLCTMITTSSRLVVVTLLGKEQLGYYAISTMVLGAIMKVPGAAVEVMEPRLMASLSSGDRQANLSRYFLRPLFNTAYYMPFAVGSIVIVFPVFVEWALPRYLPGIVPTQLLTVGAYFYAMLFVCRGIIVAKSLQSSAAWIIAVAVGLNVLMSATAIRLGLGIAGTAGSTALSMFFSLSCTILFLFHRLRFPLTRILVHLATLVFPTVIMGTALLGLTALSQLLPVNKYLYLAMELAGYNMIILTMTGTAASRLKIIDPLDPAKVFKGVMGS